MTTGISLSKSIAVPTASTLVAAMLGAASAAMLAAVVLPVHAQPSTTASVSIDNFTFGPQSLTVKAGTTVIWINKDDIPHGVASSSDDFAKSKALDTDDNYSFTFTKPGTYRYFCYIHPHMTGTIVVKAGDG